MKVFQKRWTMTKALRNVVITVTEEGGKKRW